jgi:hypothetical protein
LTLRWVVFEEQFETGSVGILERSLQSRHFQGPAKVVLVYAVGAGPTGLQTVDPGSGDSAQRWQQNS